MTPAAIGPIARLWQRFYAAAHARRRRRSRTTAARLDCPVLSVGNLHWGGGGKTPLTAALAARLAACGLAVCILSRGYRSHGRGIRLASRGRGLLLAPEQVGDEPAMLADSLPGVAVVVHPDRTLAGRWALAELAPRPDLFLLDDGFSHLRLHRDLDLLVFPASDPLAGGWLWPQGRLREPLASAAHADAAVLTGEATRTDADALAAVLARHGFGGPLLLAPTTAAAPVHQGGTLPPGTAVLLVSAVARPAAVLATAEGLGLRVVEHLVYPDHHPFPARSRAAIAGRARALGHPWVVVTAKDAVKLRQRLDLPFAVLPITSHPEPAFWHWLAARLVPRMPPQLGPRLAALEANC
jgi:tetraacyldisaccharide 4'-kinase